MSAQIISFPPRGPFAVSVVDDEDGWLVICRKHSWAHADQRNAIAEAEAVAAGFGVAVKIRARAFPSHPNELRRFGGKRRAARIRRNTGHERSKNMADEFVEHDLDTPTERDLDEAYGSRFLGVADMGTPPKKSARKSQKCGRKK